MINFLKTEYSLSLFGWIILLSAVIFLFLAGTSISHWRHQYLEKRLASNTQKTGFLGKPLLQLFVVLMLVLGAVSGFYLQYDKDSGFEISQASKKYQLSMDYRSDYKSASERNLELEIVPSISDKKWGESGDRFDIFVNIIPLDSLKQQQIDFFELDKSQDNPSKIVTTVGPGDYKLNIVIKHKNTTFGDEYQLNIP